MLPTLVVLVACSGGDLRTTLLEVGACAEGSTATAPSTITCATHAYQEWPEVPVDAHTSACGA